MLACGAGWRGGGSGAILTTLTAPPPARSLRRRTDVLWRELPSSLVVCRVDGHSLRATGSAVAVWRQLEVRCTMDELVTSLATEFSVAPEVIRPSVEEFVAELIGEEMVVVG